MGKIILAFYFCAFILSVPLFADDGTVIDNWDKIKAPAVADLASVKVDPPVTALLILDIEQRTVAPRPRALTAVPKIKKLMEWARANQILVAYSITKASTPESILTDVKPRNDELVVQSSVDKYFGTPLEKHLKDKNITTVIITGTAAEGAVLGTMIGSVTRGFKVILPVDCMPSSELYAEQYVVWHALNAPATKGNVTVTRSDIISVK